MRKTMKALLVSMSLTAALAAWGQQQKTARWKPGSYELAVSYSPERAQKQSSGDAFWMQGGGIDLAAQYRHGWSAVVALNGEHASGIGSGIDLSQLTFLAGPRFTLPLAKSKGPRLFVETLLGDAHAFNTTLPAGSGTTSSADAFALQAGGGVNWDLNRRFGLRIFQIDYERATLPNNGSNTQNNLRLAFGATWRFR
jgi:hypothetical protein